MFENINTRDFKEVILGPKEEYTITIRDIENMSKEEIKEKFIKLESVDKDLDAYVSRIAVILLSEFLEVVNDTSIADIGERQKSRQESIDNILKELEAAFNGDMDGMINHLEVVSSSLKTSISLLKEHL